MLVAENLWNPSPEIFWSDKFKGEQEEIVQSVLAGKEKHLWSCRTGGGKSMCYQLPAGSVDGTAVVSPLIALMKNQVDAMRGSAMQMVLPILNSSLNKTEIAQVKADIKSGRTKLLYVALESLNQRWKCRISSWGFKSRFAIDEAHCISEWGSWFSTRIPSFAPHHWSNR